MGLAGWGFNRLTRKYLLRWGEAYQSHEGLRIQHVQEGLGGVKDVKLLGREDDFFAQYGFHNMGSARINKRRATMQALPRLFLELLAIVGLAALVVVMIGQNKPAEMLLPVVGMFAAAAFRIMPSVNRLLGVFQALSFTLPIINTLYDEFQLLNKTKIPQLGELLSFKNTLKLERVNFQYQSAEASTLSDGLERLRLVSGMGGLLIISGGALGWWLLVSRNMRGSLQCQQRWAARGSVHVKVQHGRSTQLDVPRREWHGGVPNGPRLQPQPQPEIVLGSLSEE